MATTPEYTLYDGTPSNPVGQTPFGFFDSNTDFVTDAPKVAQFVATRLGYPIMDVELKDFQIYACFEEAVIEYGKQVQLYRTREHMLNVLGSTTSESLTGKNIVSTPLNQVIRLSKDYGTEALSGGDTELKRGGFTASVGTGSYDLKALWADPVESGSAIEIRRMYHFMPPAIARYYDPFATTGLGLTNLMAEFGFDGYSPAITFVMMPAYEDFLRLQAIEINDQIRKSQYSFTISNNIVRLQPTIKQNRMIVYFDYYVVDEKYNNTQSGSAFEYVSDISNIPFENIPYDEINSVGRVWIYKYTLALAKELLGIIRSKYERIPIPDSDIRLDGDVLRQEAIGEKDILIKELQATLDESSIFKQMKRHSEMAQYQSEILGRVPIPIYIL